MDGDRGIDERIIYSMVTGEGAPAPGFPPHTAPHSHLALRNPGGGGGGCHLGPRDLRPPEATAPNPPARPPGHEDGTFSIGADSGNLTMAKSIPSPQTFVLMVKVGARTGPGLQALPGPQAAGLTLQGPSGHGRLCNPQGEQADGARYSVTQVTVEALDANGSLPRFPESLYRGTVALGSGPGVAVQDAAAPPQPLRIRAQDPEFPVGTARASLGGGLEGPEGAAWAPDSLDPVQDLNSAITYRITNNSNFRMDGEAVLTSALLMQAGVFYAEVRAGQHLQGAGVKSEPRRDEPPSRPGGGHEHGDLRHSDHGPGGSSLGTGAQPHR